MRYLPEMTSGECITCIGMTEPSGGSDLQAMKTFAKKDGDDYILNGSKVVTPRDSSTQSSVRPTGSGGWIPR